MVRWTTDSVEVVADMSIDEIGAGTIDAVVASFATWAAVEGAYAPDVVVRRGTADAIGYAAGNENHSTIRFASGGCDQADDALAITVVSYGDDGAILDADIIINGGASRPFGILSETTATRARMKPGTTYRTS